ncbi:YveK family protein [Alteribacter natronophilus]|uniref:YveK family protein n=1 Tax=Alteribacter natronophilus TaxID=2583810 RepID=UPI0014860C9E|nr:Wzz/FepE/Etk N-terminal domain-containing protein [Alteribacter natronophilus]
MQTNANKEIEIKRIYSLLKKRLWIIILFAAVTTSAGYMYHQSIQPEPVYDSTARIMIPESSGYMNTLRVFITEPPVMEAVISELDLGMSPDALSSRIDVTAVSDSQIVMITARAGSPEMAAAIANTTAEQYQEVVAETLGFTDVEPLSAASYSANQLPINPTSSNIIYAAAIFGVFTAVGFIFLLDSIDNRVRHRREVEKMLQVPVIGDVSKMTRRTMQLSRRQKKAHAVRGETIGESTKG